MSKKIRLEGCSDLAAPKARILQPPLPGDLAEQVKFLAGDPSEGVLWSDLLDHLRGGFRNARRAFLDRTAPRPR